MAVVLVVSDRFKSTYILLDSSVERFPIMINERDVAVSV